MRIYSTISGVEHEVHIKIDAGVYQANRDKIEELAVRLITATGADRATITLV